VPEVSFAATKARWAGHDPAGGDALLAVLEKESNNSSNFFSKQKREGLRMMHTPRTTLLLVASCGAFHQSAQRFGRRARASEIVRTG